MTSIEYHKLVRDRIPEIIEADGKVAETVTLGEAEFVAALRTKLVEEAREAADAVGREALLTELADVLEVVLALVDRENAGLEELDAVRRRRASECGAFERHLLLQRTYDAPADGGSDESGDVSAVSGTMRDVVAGLYDLIQHLPKRDWRVASGELPRNGIYLFFERGEMVEVGGRTCERIVRVGTHKKDGRFRSRIRDHYGPYSSLGGSRKGSVFRKHLGGALLRRTDLEDVRLDNWLARVGEFPEVEAEVSRVLRDDFSFVCFPVENEEERLGLESRLIGLLAQYPTGMPSGAWLGRHAKDGTIRQSGLWNVREVDADPLTVDLLERIRVLAGIG